MNCPGTRWLVFGAVLLVSCGGTDEAKQGVDEFRTAVAAKNYHDIFEHADPEMRQSGTEEQFVEFMKALDKKLGPWQSAEEGVWTVSQSPAGRIVNLTYQSQFANGPGTERFMWRIENGQASLVGYHVDSPLWVTH